MEKLVFRLWLCTMFTAKLLNGRLWLNPPLWLNFTDLAEAPSSAFVPGGLESSLLCRCD